VKHIQRWFITGLFLLLPLVVTLWILVKAVKVLSGLSTPWVQAIFSLANVTPPPGVVTGLAFGATVLFILLVGGVGGSVFGKRLLSVVEKWLYRLPLIRTTYVSAKQLVDAIGLGKGGSAFSAVVMIEFPRKRLYSIGFVTRPVRWLKEDEGMPSEMVHVFIPTTPNPTSGWLILVPREEARVLDMSVEMGIKLVVSGGMVSP